MNRLTAIGLASLVAYGLLIATKYTGIVSAAREDKPSHTAEVSDEAAMRALTGSLAEQPAPAPVQMPAPIARPATMQVSTGTHEFRSSRDLKAFADSLLARRASLSGDERYNLARALEECQFTTTINEDIAAYSSKQRRQFLSSLPANDTNSTKRIAAYDAADVTQRCLRFQGSKISQKDIEDLYNAAAQQGDARAQARILVAELNAKMSNTNRADGPGAVVSADNISGLIGLLESRDPEAIMQVGTFLSQSSVASQLHLGPNGETPEPSALLGAFSLVACDISDCQQLSREPLLACAYSGYCDSHSFEELYQNFMASPYAYSNAARYRNIIQTAIQTQNWSLLGLASLTNVGQSNTKKLPGGA